MGCQKKGFHSNYWFPPPQEHTAWTKPDDIVTIKKNQQIHNNTKLLKY